MHRHDSLHKCSIRCALNGRVHLHNTGQQNVHNGAALTLQVPYECGERRAEDLGAENGSDR